MERILKGPFDLDDLWRVMRLAFTERELLDLCQRGMLRSYLKAGAPERDGTGRVLAREERPHNYEVIDPTGWEAYVRAKVEALPRDGAKTP